MPLEDVFGQAILDHYRGGKPLIKTYSSIAGWDELPVDYLFRSFEAMPEIEQFALNSSKGRVLDLGCGAGSHSLFLQDQGLEVWPIDISPKAVEVCQMRGLKRARNLNFWDLEDRQFDTILSLMNGAGICGKMERVPEMLKLLKSRLSARGQIFLDSSDIIYMFEDEHGNTDLPESKNYYGEVVFNMRYQDQDSGHFPWLYLDFYNLRQQASHIGLECEMVVQGEHYDYLARLTHTG